jgi:DNA polymerase-3 subunit epsilon
MREIVLDTETTGLDPNDGHRVVEIGAVELVNHVPTGRTFHKYINPERTMPVEAFEVHGIGADILDPPRPVRVGDVTLADKPLFTEVVDEFVAFIENAILVIHNAAFDMAFLNAEFARHGLPILPGTRAKDTVAIARRKHPGSPANLDALCRRYGVDNSGREKHGALLDAELLAEVYLELIGGRQPDFALGVVRGGGGEAASDDYAPPPRPLPLADPSSDAERAAHAAFVEKLGAESLWRKLES